MSYLLNVNSQSLLHGSRDNSEKEIAYSGFEGPSTPISNSADRKHKPSAHLDRWTYHSSNPKAKSGRSVTSSSFRSWWSLSWSWCSSPSCWYLPFSWLCQQVAVAAVSQARWPAQEPLLSPYWRYRISSNTKTSRLRILLMHQAQ
jgi:hypothetical protein